MSWIRVAALLTLVGSVLMTAVACGDDDDEASPTTAATAAAAGGASAVTAKVADNSFPAETKVSVGGKVTWDWAGSSNPHSVVGTSANAKDLLKSQTLTGGTNKYEVTFTQAGTYEYQCGVHGAAMTGKVVVQ